MQTLNRLLSAIVIEEITGGAGSRNPVITELTADSRRVVPGAMFVAVRGPLSDGHDYIAAALAAGATAIVCERFPTEVTTGVQWVRVSNSAVALGYLASEWYGNPSRKLTLVGVTGTNGKTTTATLLYEMARLSGGKAGLLSTVENRVNDTVYPSVNTTPSPLETNRLLAEMVDQGCTFAAMEVSSHGMVQHRTAGLHFAGGIFTNLTRDHLDYHGTFKAYLEAKKSFFDLLPSTAWALVNIDDSHGRIMLQNTRARRLTYSLRDSSDFRGRVVESRIDGMVLTLNGIEVHTAFAGRFNAYNLTAVFGAWIASGHEPEATAVEISRLVPVAGRFQTYTSADGVTVVVDYAHTPDALENVLTTIRDTIGGRGSITTVTGAGGNRDHGKRPMMGAIAARYSARVVITSDNPRDENPEDIARDIAGGIPVDTTAVVTIMTDRAQAIATAVAQAAPGDVVLVAGKGHEDYQEFADHRRVHFDDREQALQALTDRNTARTN